MIKPGGIQLTSRTTQTPQNFRVLTSYVTDHRCIMTGRRPPGRARPSSRRRHQVSGKNLLSHTQLLTDILCTSIQASAVIAGLTPSPIATSAVSPCGAQFYNIPITPASLSPSASASSAVYSKGKKLRSAKQRIKTSCQLTHTFAYSPRLIDRLR